MTGARVRIALWALIAMAMVGVAGGGYAFGTTAGSITAKRVVNLPTTGYQPIGKIRGIGKIEAFCDNSSPPARLAVRFTNTSSKQMSVNRLVSDNFGTGGNTFDIAPPNGTSTVTLTAGSAALLHFHISPGPNVPTGSKPQADVDLSGTVCPGATVAMLTLDSN